jgi:hypothetical protein
MSDTAKTSVFKTILLFMTLFIPNSLAKLVRSQTSTSIGGVYGWCDFEWSSSHSVSKVRCGAEDKACDAHSVYAELYLYSDNSATDLEKTLAKYTNGDGCKKRTWDRNDHSWDNLPRSNLAKARVRACVAIQGPGQDQCYWGNLVDNTNTAG